MQDLRLAIRALFATPVISAIAVLSLALCIGGSTAIFSRTGPRPDDEHQVVMIFAHPAE